jgi:hypothetical protein
LYLWAGFFSQPFSLLSKILAKVKTVSGYFAIVQVGCDPWAGHQQHWRYFVTITLTVAVTGLLTFLVGNGNDNGKGNEVSSSPSRR